MGYDRARLSKISQGLVSTTQWQYVDTGGETIGTYQGSGYFADAKKYGVDTGDPITIVDQSSKVTYRGHFIEVQDTGDSQGTVRLDTGQP